MVTPRMMLRQVIVTLLWKTPFGKKRFQTRRAELRKQLGDEYCWRNPVAYAVGSPGLKPLLSRSYVPVRRLEVQVSTISSLEEKPIHFALLQSDSDNDIVAAILECNFPQVNLKSLLL